MERHFDSRPDRQKAEDRLKILQVLRLHVGIGNAISRPVLATRTGLNERTVRLCIEHLRKNDGVMICYVQSTGGGYYLAERVSDLEACRNTELSRENHVRENRTFFEEAMNQAQQSLFG